MWSNRKCNETNSEILFLTQTNKYTRTPHDDDVVMVTLFVTLIWYLTTQTQLLKHTSKNTIQGQKQPAEVFCKKTLCLEILQNSQESTCGRDSFFNKVAGLRPATLFKKSLRPATLLKKSLWHKCFPVNFMKFLRATFLQKFTTPNKVIEAVAQNCCAKAFFLKVSQNSQENTCARVSFIIKLQVSSWKKRLLHMCFLWILRNFWEHFFMDQHCIWGD